MTRAEKRRTMKEEQKKEQYAKSGFGKLIEPKWSNKYNITPMDAMSGYAFYDRHYDSNPQYPEHRDAGYTFFGDMMCYIPYYKGEALLEKLQEYEALMLKRFCKGNPQAYEVMIDSLNLLGWVLYGRLGNNTDEVTDWLFKEYERLMYRAWKEYVTEEEMGDIMYNLN